MNGPLRKVSIFVAVMMAALLINTTWISVGRTEALNEHPLNRRVRDAEFAQYRGAILVGNDPIAVSTETESNRFPWRRSYPDGRLWAPVTGWYAYEYGRSGLEAYYAPELSGTAASMSVTRTLDVLSGRQSQGASISTTLNPAAQQAALTALGKKRGAVVAMNYETGEILALVSTPTFDPERLSSLDLSDVRESWDELLNDPDEPLKNRATREIYPPGSTFKLVVAAAALKDGKLPGTELEAPTSFRLPNSSRSIGNSTDCGGTTVTLEQALKTSCNTAFASLGLELGQDKIRDMAESFGFNQEQTIDIAAATSGYPTEMDEAQTALSAIGQFDVTASPLQIVQVAAAIANDGVAMKPYLVSTVTNRDLTVVSSQQPERLSQPLSRTNAQLLQQMMETVVDDGTGRPARIDGLTVGGKTGTAQSAPDRPPYAWFVGYAKEPKVAVVAFVENADVARDDISGGRLAAPIFKSVVEALR
ncbi:peptidoglycan D,D-transpeptidase FtsI family protein [Tessaracoccus caeni]|uniref:peptidoglycan D,D-transpeptidase FtsI family protein n=1 Tax=Tessaracoccus caeni TaxID=3031239 RepID=UPI0023D9B6CB|nr:penicillin-binding protein 2 [Tessaracoccus caeni]MDF1487255.1 penicillin-binding protein 2 [Tessaracoccus caeni]